MIKIKHPRPNAVKFKEIIFGDTFISCVSDGGLYSKIYHPDSFANAFNLATGLLAKFEDDEQVTLVDIVVEYTLRK